MFISFLFSDGWTRQNRATKTLTTKEQPPLQKLTSNYLYIISMFNNKYNIPSVLSSVNMYVCFVLALVLYCVAVAVLLTLLVTTITITSSIITTPTSIVGIRKKTKRFLVSRIIRSIIGSGTPTGI